MKTIAMSVRVSPDDAEFIAGLAIPGASTPSDKLRSIIGQARARTEGTAEYASCLALVQDMLSPARQRVREAEHRHRVNSELLAAVLDWLPETLAGVMSQTPEGSPAPTSEEARKAELKQLADLESALADRVFMLIELVLRMGVTRECRGYDRKLVADRIAPAIELAQLLAKARSQP